MKTGDLVRPASDSLGLTPLAEEGWKGLVIGHSDGDPVVYWNDKFPAEVEYADQLEVISEVS